MPSLYSTCRTVRALLRRPSQTEKCFHACFLLSAHTRGFLIAQDEHFIMQVRRETRGKGRSEETKEALHCDSVKLPQSPSLCVQTARRE